MSLWRNGLFLSLLIPLLSQKCNCLHPIINFHHSILALRCNTPRQSSTAQYVRLLQLEGHLCCQTLLLYFLQISKTQVPCPHNILLGLGCLHNSGMVYSSNFQLDFTLYANRAKARPGQKWVPNIGLTVPLSLIKIISDIMSAFSSPFP